MRYAVVVSVFLYFELAIGFVNPSVISQLLKKIVTQTPKNARLNVTTLLQKTLLQPVNKNNTDDLQTSPNGEIDKSLYENINEKENNVSERSFIFINQRFRTRNHYQNILSQNLRQDDKSFMIGEDNNRFHELKNRFLPENPDVYKNKHLSSSKIEEAAILYCDPPDQCSDNMQVADAFRPMEDKSEKIYLNNIEGVNRDYMELLKPPIIRSENSSSPEVKDENIFLTAAQFNRPLSAYSKYGTNNQETPSDISHEEINYEYPTPTNSRLSSGHDVVYKTHNYEEVNDSSGQEGLTVEDDKILDKYLQGKMNKEGKQLKYDECNYRDCVTRSVFKTTPKQKNKKPACQCASKLNLKKKQDNNNILITSKDRTERAHYKKITPIPIFPDNSEELISDGDDVTKVINKVNYALRL